MVALPRTVDVEKEAGGSGMVFIEEGRYRAVIVSSEMKDTKTGGKMVAFKIIITEGAHKDTEFVEYINVVNSNPEAVNIGLRQIANMGKAVGLTHVNDSNELHNKPLIIEVKNKKSEDWVNDKGETVEGRMKSEIKKYHPVSSGTTQVQAQPQQQITPAQTEQAAPAQEQAVNPPATNPFA